MGILGTFIGGAVGGIVGLIIPGIGPALGFSIGASIGATVSAGDPPGVTQGRLDDLRVSGSSFGDPIRRSYGTIRQPTQIIWTSGLIEKKSKKKEGGGLFTSGTEVTTFKYFAHLACLICEGEIKGIRKIWMNGKLIYNVADDAGVTDISESLKEFDAIRIYTGSETQTPDSFLEQEIGSGLVPAHRGMAYIVIERLKLKQFFNRIPNIEVEVVKDTATSSPPVVLADLTNEVTDREASLYDGGTVIVSDISTSGLDSRHEFDHLITRLDLSGNILEQVTHEVREDSSTSSATYGMCKNDPYVVILANIVESGTQSRLFYEGVKIGTEAYPSGQSNGPLGTDDHELYNTGTPGEETIKRAYGTYYFSIAGTVGSNLKGIIRYIADSFGRPTFNWDLAVARDDFISGYPATSTINLFPDAEDENILWAYSDDTTYRMIRCDLDLNILQSWNSTQWGSLNSQQNSSLLVGPGYCMSKTANATATVTLRTFDHTTTNSTVTTATVSVDNTTSYSGVIPIGNTLIMTKYEIVSRLDLVNKGGQNLSNIVSEICLDAGYSAGEIDVTDLTGTVKGFSIPQPVSARRSIEELQRVKYFDGTEVDDKLTWIMRGGSSVATIPEADLAAHDDGTTLPDLTSIERQSILELPHTLTVNYLDDDSNYEQGSQYARRLVTDATHEAQLSVNVVLDADEAAQAADVLLYNTHQEMELIEISLSDEYKKLVPTDLITIPVNEVNTLCRIVEITGSQEGFMQLRVVPEHTAVYTQSRTGVSTGFVYDDAVGTNGAALLSFMDIPMLTQADDNVGVYAGVGGFLTTWRAHNLHRYSEENVSWGQIASFVEESVSGVTTATLPDARVGVLDWTNTLTVRPANSAMTFTSSTATAVMADRTINRMALGNQTAVEIIQFVTATDNADGTFDLDGLVRGRYGTEYATTEHTPADSFCMLDTDTVQRLIMSSTDIGVARSYKFVGEDQEFDLVPSTQKTIDGISVMPLSPVHISAVESGSPVDWVITWSPRSRYLYNLLSNTDYVDDPEIVSYTVDIIDTSSPETVARSTDVTVGTETFTYTNAMQNTDFGATQTDITVVVYQKGSIFGEGHGARYDTSTDTETIVDPKV